MTQNPAERPSMVFDHVGMVVPDLHEAVEFYVTAFGFTVDSWEADTDVNPDAIGLPGEAVRLRGAILNGGNARLELHQYLNPTGTAPRRVSDQGIGHFAFTVTDIHASHEYLAGLGVTWNTEPNLITDGVLAGRWWVYGKDPWGNVIELGQNPAGRQNTAPQGESKKP